MPTDTLKKIAIRELNKRGITPDGLIDEIVLDQEERNNRSIADTLNSVQDYDRIIDALLKISDEDDQMARRYECRERVKSLGLDVKEFDKEYRRQKENYKQYSVMQMEFQEKDEANKVPDTDYYWPPGYYIEDKSIYFGKKKNKVQVYPGIIYPDGIYKNIDDGTFSTELVFNDDSNQKVRQIFSNNDLASKNKLLNFAEMGLKVDNDNGHQVVRLIQNFKHENEGHIPIKQTVSNLGWRDDFKEFVPYSKKIICSSINQNRKKYDGVTAQKGSSTRSYKLIIDLIHTNPVNYLLVCSALSSLLVKPLGCGTQIVHLQGESSTSGKSKAMMALASMFGDYKKIIDPFNSSIAGRRESVSFLNNYPYFLDELEGADEKDLPMLFSNIYEMTQGTPKAQAKQNGDAKNNYKFWDTVIMTNGEHDLTPPNAKKGMLNRVLDIKLNLGQCLLFPIMEENEEINPIDGKPVEYGNVERIAAQNYGFVGRDFIQYLLEQFRHKDFLEKQIRKYEVTQFTLSKHYSNRQSDIGALIRVTTWLFSDFMKQKGYDLEPLDDKEIYRHLKTNTDIDTDRQALDILLQTVETEKGHFFIDTSTGGNNGNGILQEPPLEPVYGIIKDEAIYIVGKTYNKILTDNGYINNISTLLKWLDKKDLIIKSKGKKKRYRIHKEEKGLKTTFVAIKKEAYEYIS